MSDRNLDALTAKCAKCGPVAIKYKSGTWRCVQGIKEQKGPGGGTGGHGLSVLRARHLKEGASCAICGSTSKLNVDHCHVTGVLRGVLCSSCNHGLARFKDDPERLSAAIAYLANARGSR